VDVYRSIPEAFAEQVRRGPDRPAIAGGALDLSYAELDATANRFAHRVLDARGPGPGRVALLGAEDAPLFAAVLGVLKAGKAAVVLNAGDTPARLEQILEDAEPELLLAQSEHVELARSAGISESDLMTIGDPNAGGANGAPEVTVDPDAIAFLHYTSGSTGRPRGVIQSHRSYLRRCARLIAAYELEPGDRLALLVSISGAAGSGSLWPALLSGATSCPFLIAEQGLSGLAGWATRQQVTVIVTLASVFRHVLKTVGEGEVPPLRFVMTGGEQVTRADLDACRAVFGPGCTFTTSLSSTESGLLTRHRVADDERFAPGALPAGRPVPGVELALLDETGREVGPGETGEIAVCGEQSFVGYWRDEALTASRFSESERGRVLRTGDLGRLTPDGVLLVVGRTDLQVKVRGNRVSLTEIETAIVGLPGVAAATVCATATPSGDNRLTAFLTTVPGADLTAAGVRDALLDLLPAREMPTRFVFVDSFPVTPQGKVDREQLVQSIAAPNAGEGADERDGELSGTEAALAAIWSTAFDITPVAYDADFFALGGDSLSAHVIAAGVHRAFGVQLDLREILDNPTVAGLAVAIEGLRSQGARDQPPIERVGRDAPLPMSFAQERTWRFSRTAKQSAGYTDAALVRISGPLDADLLRGAIDHLVRRHEMLRTTFAERDGEPVQLIHAAQPVELPLIDLSAEDDAERRAFAMLAETARVPFDLERGPLLRLQLVRAAPEQHYLAWVDHHIICDAWSWRMFFDELAVLYDAAHRGDPPPLPDELPLGYGDFAAWERRWLAPSSQYRRDEVDWWREALHDAPAATPDLPFTRSAPEPAAAPSEGTVFWGLPPDVSKALDKIGSEEQATHYIVRLAVLAAQLVLETGRDDFVFGTYGTGRRLAGTQDILGYFANLLTLRVGLDADLTFRETVAVVRRSLLDTSPHTVLPYEVLCDELRTSGIVPPEIRMIFAPEHPSDSRAAELEFAIVKREYSTHPWGFTFVPNSTREASECKAHFDPRIYDPAGVREFLARHVRMATEVGRNPDRPLSATAIARQPRSGQLTRHAAT
jgi:amino acid adenylation domain-containing protein